MDTQRFEAEAELTGYRSVSATAVFSLIAGLFSVLALLNTMLWFIPIVGTLIGIFSLIRLRWRSDQLSGYTIAVIGFLLSLFFLALAPAQHFSSRSIIEKRSIEYSEQWLRTVLNGELEKAHQAHTYYWSRQPDGTDLKQFYESSVSWQNRLEKFFGSPVLQQVQRFSADSKIIHRKTRVIHFGVEHIAAIHFFEIQEGDYSMRLNVDAERIEEFNDVYWSIIQVYAENELTQGTSDSR